MTRSLSLSRNHRSGRHLELQVVGHMKVAEAKQKPKQSEEARQCYFSAALLYQVPGKPALSLLVYCLGFRGLGLGFSVSGEGRK